MKCLFIYNPKSGNGQILNHLSYIIDELSEKYDILDVYESKSAEDIIENVKKGSSVYDVIVFAGGDGTFNNVACGISGCENRPVLGYIPTGTGCDIARNLKIPRNVKKAVKIIKSGYTIKHDVGMINDSYFVYVVAIGACTGTPYTTKQWEKKVLGKLAYVKDGLNEFFKTPVNEVKITTENKTITTTVPLMLIMNTISVGGIPFNRYCHLNDGLFDVVLINNGSNAGRLNILKYFIRGIFGLNNKKSAVTLSASEIKVEINDQLHWCVDGERGPKGNVVIKNLHNHLTILAPKGKAKTQKQYK